MNLTSCDECGAVFDRDKINFPGNYDYDEDNQYPSNRYVWNGDRYTRYVQCPVCKEGKILKEDE